MYIEKNLLRIESPPQASFQRYVRPLMHDFIGCSFGEVGLRFHQSASDHQNKTSDAWCILHIHSIRIFVLFWLYPSPLRLLTLHVFSFIFIPPLFIICFVFFLTLLSLDLYPICSTPGSSNPVLSMTIFDSILSLIFPKIFPDHCRGYVFISYYIFS